MKNIALFALTTALLLSGCQNIKDLKDTSSLRAEINVLKTDIADLKQELYGDPNTRCEDSLIITDIDIYQHTLDGLPSSDLDPADWHKANGERPDVMTSPTGLQYMVVRDGKPESPKPEGGEIINVFYHGFFPDGEIFDSAYKRGESAKFPANRVIPGWVEALSDMQPCEARTLYIPGDLAYGTDGRPGIPPNATLLFHVQLLGVGDKQFSIREKLDDKP